MTPNGRRIEGWADLDVAEFVVLREAMGHYRLADVLNAWVPDDDAAYWNRKGEHVAPLVDAAVRLLRAGLLEVWEVREDGIGDGGFLPPDVAETALTTPSNWWRYDPDGNWDDTEDLARYRVYEEKGEDLSPWHTYSLIATEAASRLTPGASDAVREAGPLEMSMEELEAHPITQLARRWNEARARLFAGEQTVRCPVNDDANLKIEWTPASGQSEKRGTYRTVGRHRIWCPECRAEQVVVSTERAT